ncbi:MAG: Ycf66 family protein [Scytonema sp. PMC 1069.18]|nr:Ycf66 family protein [Scytonema sp. PMC 1069.18]MEC4882663.1 Ycf66 family protein [Scytonema sp. PMC 1070.18]
MLAYVLALTVGLGSVAFYAAAFFFPEIHRKNDFILSGVAAFYALVLWIFAPRITGGLLLGHVASVTLLGWLSWQTLSLRYQLTPNAQRTQVPSSEQLKTDLQQRVSRFPLSQQFAQFQMWFRRNFTGVKDKVQHIGEQKTPPTPTQKPAVEVVDERTSTPEQPTPPATETTTPTAEKPTETVTTANTSPTVTVTPPTPPNPPSSDLIEEAQETAEDKTTPPPVEEIAPDASLAPPAEAPPGKIPPNSTEQS